MPMVVVCPVCGTEWETTREEILSGRWWGGCPVCRPPTRDDPPATVSGAVVFRHRGSRPTPSFGP